MNVTILEDALPARPQERCVNKHSAMSLRLERRYALFIGWENTNQFKARPSINSSAAAKELQHIPTERLIPNSRNVERRSKRNSSSVFPHSNAGWDELLQKGFLFLWPHGTTRLFSKLLVELRCSKSPSKESKEVPPPPITNLRSHRFSSHSPTFTAIRDRFIITTWLDVWTVTCIYLRRCLLA